MKELIQAIFSSFNSGNDFYNAIGGRMFSPQAPEGTPLPYAVLKIVSSTPERTFTEYFRDALMTISLFSQFDNEVATEIEDLYEYQRELFDEKPLTITGFSLLWMREVNLTTITDELTTTAGVTPVKAWHVDYEIKASMI
jgi:hypothetical protein